MQTKEQKWEEREKKHTKKTAVVTNWNASIRNHTHSKQYKWWKIDESTTIKAKKSARCAEPSIQAICQWKRDRTERAHQSDREREKESAPLTKWREEKKKLSRASNVHTGRITKTVRLLEIKYMRCVNTKESMWKTYNKTVAVHTKCRMCLPCREIWIRCVFIFFRWYLLLGCVRLFSVCSLVRSFCVARFFYMLFYICRANWLLLVGCAATVTIVAFSAIRTRSSLLSLSRLAYSHICICVLLHYCYSIIMKIFDT